MIRWRMTHLALGASAALICGRLPTLAQEAPDCSFVCKLTGQSARDLVPQAPQAPVQDVRQDSAEAPTAAAPAKAKAKPKIVPVLIATDEPEAGPTRALAAGLKAHPVKIVSSGTPAAADLTIAPEIGPVAGAPLFREDLHVIGRADLVSLADLQGRTVSLGAEGSAGQAIARKILAARQITIREVPLDLDNALDGVATGDLDALVVFAPQPFARLNDLPGKKLHLIGVASSAGDDKDLAPSFIPTSAYPALATDADTPTLSVAVHATARAHGARAREAALVAAALATQARKTVAAQPAAERRSVAVSR